MVFGNGVKNIQAAAYNGARTVDGFVTYAKLVYVGHMTFVVC